MSGRSQRVDETVAIGAEPVRRPIGEDHRIHGPQRGCRRVEGVDRLGDDDLVRHGHGETSETLLAGRGHETRPVLRRDILSDHLPRKTRGGESGVVDRRGQRVGHRMPDHGDALTRDGHGSTPARLAAAMLSWCCSKVTAKAWPPSKSAST